MVMVEDASKLAAELDRLNVRVRQLEHRMSDVEAQLGGADYAAAREQEAARAAALEPAGPSWTVGLPALVGRTIMALGGAFLLRAMTESGAVPDTVGVATGLAYALVWTWGADRSARAGRTLDATLHGLTTILIAFPLIAETTARLEVIRPPVAAVTLAAVAGVVLYVAWLRELEALAWIVTVASTATGVVLLFATKSLALFTPVLFALAAASLAASYHRGWYGLRWPAALALDVLVLLAMFLMTVPGYEWLHPRAVATVQLLMTAMYLGIIGVRTLWLGHPMREFGVIQSLLVLVIGLEGARRVLGPDFAWAGAFAWVALVLATASYAVSFLYLHRDARHRASLAWYTTLGTILAIYGLRLLVASTAVGVIWALMALVGARMGVRDERRALRWNVAALAVAAAFGSGLAWTVYAAFWAADPAKWLALPPAALTVSALCLAAWFALRWTCADETLDRAVPGLALLAVAAIGIGSAVVAAAGPAVAGVSGADADLAALAVLRTSVLVVASLSLAALSRLRLRREIAWIAYAALALTACKIAVEDLPSGRAMTIFMSFVLFGGALIAAPQLVRESEPNEPRPTSSPHADR